MKDVLIDSGNFEAASLISFTAKEDDGDFQYNPYWIDNITHLSGFVLNVSDAVDHSKVVYISHGWESCKIARPISGDTTYRNYVKMQPGPRNTMVGDVYVFEKNEVVAVIGGVKFQAIQRALLDKLLPPNNGFVAPSTQQKELTKEGTEPQKQDKGVQIVNDLVSRLAVRSTTGPLLDTFMSIVADELGMKTSELLDKSEFASIGLDSLMSLSVTGRIREVLDIDVPTSLFTDNSTIGEAKSALLTLIGDKPIIGHIFGELSNYVQLKNDGGNGSDEAVDEAPSDNGDLNEGNVASGSAMDKILMVISDELGTNLSELDDAAEFGDVGVDSLMSLSIISRIREELDLEIPTSFFKDNPIVGDAKFALEALILKSVTATPTYHSSEESLRDDSLATSVNSEVNEMEKTNTAATSILLKGNRRTASKTLFLLPDGSGSATSYSFVPLFSSSVCIYGLNCPYMKTPSGYTDGIESVALQYLSEIRRRQKTGPYSLGGWSAGGVLAYEVASELQRQGQIVENLILIDSPCPGNIEPLPSEFLHFIESQGLLISQSNTAAPPSWLIPHFEASVRNLASYKPVPMDPKKAPKTFIIWARESIYQHLEDDGKRFPHSQDQASTFAFFLGDRRDFGSNGWEKLLGEDNITCVSMEGNHFTMMREPTVSLYSASQKCSCTLTYSGRYNKCLVC